MGTRQVLPPLLDNTGSVHVRLLDGGSFTANYDVLHADVPSTPFRCYSWAFYIHHEPSGRHILWDVGLSDDPSEYTAYSVKHIIDVLEPVRPRLSLSEQLKSHGVDADDIDTVIFSHHHWDHSRPIRGMFPKALGLFGPGTFAHCTPGQFHDEPYDAKGEWDANFFHPQNATENCAELQGEWKQFGPFEKALDFFGDGSMWVLQAPGHMPGNLAAAVCLPSGSWVILASDCCHSRALLEGKADFKTWKGPLNQNCSLHTDLDAARQTVSKIRSLEVDYGSRIVLAHDSSWMLAGTDKVLFSLLGDQMLEFARNRLPKGDYP
ncbi:hypothetical protein NM208_g1940 [Fusarium decemcellulare]|uniref:Uncharacterized protein n=1 Tax=Fusarium decemcellulare TaxID=57161 RepID=A0ACC1SUK3_9HYPO|nr:hypothetical protein NM208_g1940 [Fusarium decemcellulare]